MNITTSVPAESINSFDRLSRPHLSGSAGGVGVEAIKTSSAPLGILTKSCNPPTPSEVNTEAVSRLKKWARQSAARSIVKGRLNVCCRTPIPRRKSVDIWESKKHTFSYGGLIVCGSVWVCPVCASKITEKRRQELSTALEVTKAEGGTALLLTLTVPHYGHHKVQNVLNGLTNAYRKFTNRKGFKRAAELLGVFGRVRTLEVTYGPNGWHPHLHVLLFIQKPITQNIVKLTSAALLDQWKSACVAAGLPEPNKHGLNLDDGSKAAQYVSKWGMDHEMTKGHLKTGRTNDHLSPFALLDLHLDKSTADTPFQQDIAPLAGFLFHEYAKAFRGKRQLVWSDGLRDLLELAPEKTDEELAEEHDQQATIFTQIPVEFWPVILRADKRGEVLEICKNGHAAFYGYLRHLYQNDPTPPPLPSTLGGEVRRTEGGGLPPRAERCGLGLDRREEGQAGAFTGSIPSQYVPSPRPSTAAFQPDR